MFEEAGVATKIEGNGKIFPVSDRATDVLDALVRRLERSGATLRCQSPVLGDRALGARRTQKVRVSRSSCRTRPSLRGA